MPDIKYDNINDSMARLLYVLELANNALKEKCLRNIDYGKL